MSTSGVTSLSATRNSIIRGTFRMLGFKKNGGVRPAQEVLDAENTLNIMLKSWQSMDIGLWLNREATLYTDYQSSQYYSLGTSGDHATLTPYSTAIATAASSGDSSVTVDSDDNITDGDYIGIELDDKTMQWTTVDGTPSSDVVALDDVLTDDVAVDNVVYNYTTRLSRPMEIIEARCRQSGDTEIPINIVSRNDYMEMTDKDTTGKPNMVYYDPQLTAGRLYVWPISDDVENKIVMTVKYPIELFSAYNNDVELPDEWINALQSNLAKQLLPEYPGQVSAENIILIRSMAKESLEAVTIFDNDSTSYRFTPSSRRGY